MASFDFDLSNLPRSPKRNPAWEEMLARAGTYTRREKVQRWMAHAFWTVVSGAYYRIPRRYRSRTPGWVINRPHRAMLRWKNTRVRMGTMDIKGLYSGSP